MIKSYDEIIFLHMWAAVSKICFFIRPKLRSCNTIVCGQRLIPLLSSENEMYLLLGTELVIIRGIMSGRLHIINRHGEVSIESVLDTYPREVIEPLLFNINMFN